MSRSAETRARERLVGAALLVTPCALFAVYAGGQWEYTIWFVRAWFP
jgi:hypothetical protein